MTVPAVAQPNQPADFVGFLTTKLAHVSNAAKSGSAPQVPTLQSVCPVENDALFRRVLSEYGAIFVAADAVQMPPTCAFAGESEVSAFQETVKRKFVLVSNYFVELQEPAAAALEAAQREAIEKRLRITPLDGPVAGRRSFADTLRLWNSRFYRALNHWNRQGKISESDVKAAANADLRRQIAMVMEWESKGLYFSTTFSKSIFSSTAPPGTSQHIAMLAFDVAEHSDPRVRRVLNKHGWFQTIINDPPHFTYIGLPESELPSRGLKMVKKSGHVFWIPNIN